MKIESQFNYDSERQRLNPDVPHFEQCSAVEIDKSSSSSMDLSNGIRMFNDVMPSVPSIPSER